MVLRIRILRAEQGSSPENYLLETRLGPLLEYPVGIVHGISEHDAYSRARTGLDVFGRWRCFRLYLRTLETGLDLKTKHQGSRSRGGMGLPQENGGRSSGHEGIAPSGISSLPLFNKFPSS